MGGTSKISFAGYRKPQRYTDTEIEREIERERDREIEIEQKQYRKGYKTSIQKFKEMWRIIVCASDFWGQWSRVRIHHLPQ